MDSSGSVFSETLHSVTKTKLEELSKNRASWESHSSALRATAQQEPNPLQRLFVLVDGVKRCFSIGTTTPPIKDLNGQERLGPVILGCSNNSRLEQELKNLDQFLEQARFDPSVSKTALAEWEQSLLRHLDMQGLKYNYATLYGQLVTEWLTLEKNDSKADLAGDENVEMTDAFEEIPGTKKLESRTAWEKMVFEPYEIDQQALRSYLVNLFGVANSEKQEIYKVFKALTISVRDFEGVLARQNQFTLESLRWTIEGLQTSDLLNDEKRAALKDFLQNDTILNEIADVLNMRMAALQDWSWGEHVLVEQRRKINGVYSIHLHEDLLQAILLQYIGVKWSVFMKRVLREFHRRIVPLSRKAISPTDWRRRGYYLGHQSTQNSLQERRLEVYRQKYYLFQLLDSEKQKLESDEGETEVAHTQYYQQAQQQAQQATLSMSVQAPAMVQQAYSSHKKRPRAAPGYTAGKVAEPRNPMEAKQSLLHLVSTEIAINLQTHGEMTCFRSAFEQWNPLLPHGTILSVLSFFGVSQKWLTFFEKYLKAPLKFMDEESVDPRTRQRGMPGSHALSDVFGELILFCLDFAVTQATDGGLLHRVYDEFWFWSPEHSTCVQAWQAIERFNKAMGVSISQNVKGAARIGRGSNQNLPIDPSLPSNKIRWGFLYLDPITGKFDIDQSLVDKHIEELRHQLQTENKSIFSWIRTWNTYATTFITSNFGKPATCFGREHVDKILTTHERIHRTIFAPFGKDSVVEYIKDLLNKRFGVQDVPDGFLFFPIELGGLELKSPFINPLQLRNSLPLDPHTSLLHTFEEYERQAYVNARQRFLNSGAGGENEGSPPHITANDPKWRPEPHDQDTFFSFDEYTRYRETIAYGFSNNLRETFNDLMRVPSEEANTPTFPSHLSDALDAVDGSTRHIQGEKAKIATPWAAMQPYWKGIAALYGTEMMERFGGFNLVDPGLLPIGMVSLFRGRMVNWQG